MNGKMTRVLKAYVYVTNDGWMAEYWADGHHYGSHELRYPYYDTRVDAILAADAAALDLITTLNRDVGSAPPFSYGGEG